MVLSFREDMELYFGAWFVEFGQFKKIGLGLHTRDPPSLMGLTQVDRLSNPINGVRAKSPGFSLDF
jgi:hypothetical protein